METRKRSILISLTISALVLFPIALYGQGQGGGAPTVPPFPPLADQIPANSPPVAQPLVPEGVLAVELVKALNIGQPQNEAEAESLLSAIGIEPRNGWIADYPVTPDIIGEIEKSVAVAADAKKLKMGKDQAQRAVENLVAKLGLNVMPGVSSTSAQAAPGGGTTSPPIYKYLDKNGVVHFTDQYESIPEEYRDQIKTIPQEAHPQPSVGTAEEEGERQVNNFIAKPAPEVINNYYYYNGPPVVTYYAPPWPYYYLYAWVPYPFWCSRVFFPGFFILHDFHRTVIFHKRRFVVTNHFVHPRTKTVFRVDPVTRKPGRRIAGRGISSPQLFSTPPAQAGARAIVAISQQRAHSARFTTKPGIRNVAPSIPPSRPQPQGSSNRRANNPVKTPPAIMNPGTSTNSTGSGSSILTGKPPGQPRFSEGRNETNPQKSLPNQVRPFGQPVQPSERSLNSRTFNQQRGSQPKSPAAVARPSVPREKMDEKSGPSPATNSGSSNRPNPPVIMSKPRVEQREPVMPGNIGNRNERNVQQAPTAGSRTFNPPATSGGAYNSPGRIFSPPPTSQNRVVPALVPRGNASVKGSGAGSRGSIGPGFFRAR